MVNGSDNQLFGSAQRCEQCFIASDRCFNQSLVLKNAPNASHQPTQKARSDSWVGCMCLLAFSYVFLELINPAQDAIVVFAT